VKKDTGRIPEKNPKGIRREKSVRNSQRALLEERPEKEKNLRSPKKKRKIEES